MIRHTVMFRFDVNAQRADIDAFSNGLTEMAPKIEEIVAFRHGFDLGVNAGNFDYVVTADFASVDGYLAYRDHPIHKEVIARTAHVVGERAAVQFEWDS